MYQEKNKLFQVLCVLYFLSKAISVSALSFPNELSTGVQSTSRPFVLSIRSYSPNEIPLGILAALQTHEENRSVNVNRWSYFPSNPQINELFELAVYDASAGRHEDSIKYLEVALVQPNMSPQARVDCWYLRSYNNSCLNRPDLVFSDINLVLAQEDTPPIYRASYLYWRGQNYIKLGRYEDAIIDFRMALGIRQITPVHKALSHYQRSICYSLLGERAEALIDINKALAVPDIPSENMAEFFYQRAVILAYSMERYNEAISDLNMALHLLGSSNEYKPAEKERYEYERNLVLYTLQNAAQQNARHQTWISRNWAALRARFF